MNLTWTFCALLGLALVSSTAFAQSDQTKIDEIRRQMEQLSSQLAILESAKASGGNQKVTHIGGSRQRLRELEREEVVIVRIYDLSDLFAVAPNYPAQHASDLSESSRPLFPQVEAERSSFGGAGGFGGGGFFSVPARGTKALDSVLGQVGDVDPGVIGARTSIDDLIEAIQSTISPSQWDTVGGSSSIAKIGSSLIVSANEVTHQQVDALVNLFRKRWGTLRTVSVRAWWLWLDAAEIQTLLNQDKADDENEPPAFGILDDDAWQKLLAGQNGEKRRRGYRAAVTCYNGQTVHTLAGGQRLVVTGLGAHWVGSEEDETKGAVAYDPVTSLVQQGAALQVTPLTNTSGRFVVLDLHTRVNDLAEPAGKPDQAPANQKDANNDGDQGGVAEKVVQAVQVPQLMNYRLSTTLRLPVEKTVLVGGMTFGDRAPDGDQDLYLFVRTTVQELRDDLDDKSKQPAEIEKEEKVEEGADEEAGRATNVE